MLLPHQVLLTNCRHSIFTHPAAGPGESPGPGIVQVRVPLQNTLVTTSFRNQGKDLKSRSDPLTTPIVRFPRFPRKPTSQTRNANINTKSLLSERTAKGGKRVREYVHEWFGDKSREASGGLRIRESRNPKPRESGEVCRCRARNGVWRWRTHAIRS